MSVALEYWIATVGHRQAQLWHCWRAPGVQWLAQEQVVLTSTFGNGATHQAPNRSDHPVAPGPLTSDQDHEFTRDIAEWLIRCAEADGVQNIEVIAPEPVLLELRKHWHQQWSGRIHEHEGDLSDLPSNKVAQHPVFTLVRGLAACRSG